HGSTYIVKRLVVIQIAAFENGYDALRGIARAVGIDCATADLCKFAGKCRAQRLLNILGPGGAMQDRLRRQTPVLTCPDIDGGHSECRYFDDPAGRIAYHSISQRDGAQVALEAERRNRLDPFR